MNYFYKGVCYENIADARLSFQSNFDDVSITANGDVISIHPLPSTGATFQVCKSVNGSACTFETYDYPGFADCEHAITSEYVMDWLIIVLPIIATIWGLKKFIKFFDGGYDK